MVSVSTHELRKVYPGNVVAVDDLTLHIEDGEFFSLLGPSGCGKTTLLRTIAGLEQATEGSIKIGDRDVTSLKPGDRDVGMVFQDYALYPHMSLVDNVAYPLKVRKVAKADRRERAAGAAQHLGLEELLERRPGELSGGQQQRVAVARAVAYEPSVFLFDEPLSNLDARLRIEARSFLRRLQQELDVCTIYVTHDQSEALALSDRMAVMRDGKIEQLGTPEEVFSRPVSLFVAGFVGSVPMNLIEAEYTGSTVRVQDTELPVSHDVQFDAGPVTVGLRPEHASLSSPNDPRGRLLLGEVTVAELMGTTHLVTVEGEGRSVRVVVDEPPKLGERVGVTLEQPRQLLLYDADGRLVDVEQPLALASQPAS